MQSEVLQDRVVITQAVQWPAGSHRQPEAVGCLGLLDPRAGLKKVTATDR